MMPEASDLFASLSSARLTDLVLRQRAGTLTNAERLALNVLAGGRAGEESIDKLIDAAMEEYSSGGYRVPVRVVGNGRRMKAFITASEHWPAPDTPYVERLSSALEANGCMVAVLPPGSSVQVFEVGDGDKVEVKSA